jgi:hypothetical protein
MIYRGVGDAGAYRFALGFSAADFCLAGAPESMRQ